MSSEPEPAPLTALADALRGLKPQPASLDRDALMFRAGQAAARRGWLWPGVSAALLLACLGLGALQALHPQTIREERTLRLPAEAPVATPPPPEPPVAAFEPMTTPSTEEAPVGTDYLRLRQLVEERGVEALPALPAWPPQPKVSECDPLLAEPALRLRRRHELLYRGAS